MPYHRTIQTMLEIPPEEMLVCGMALGYADPDAVENSLVTERAPARDFARFAGWGECRRGCHETLPAAIGDHAAPFLARAGAFLRLPFPYLRAL
jgi:hypothetical protein